MGSIVAAPREEQPSRLPCGREEGAGEENRGMGGIVATSRSAASSSCLHGRRVKQDCTECSGCPHGRRRHGCDLCRNGVPGTVKLRAFNLSPVYAAIILNGWRQLDIVKDGETREGLHIANLEGEIVLVRTTIHEHRQDTYEWGVQPPRRNRQARALAERIVACNTDIDIGTAFQRMRCTMATGTVWFLAEIGATAGRREYQVQTQFSKAQLRAECVALGIGHAHTDTNDVLRAKLRRHGLGGPAETEPSLRTCVAGKAKWTTKIEQVFPLRRSIPLVRVPPFCEQGVFTAEIPAGLLPRKALGDEGLRRIAVLSASHASRPAQMRHPTGSSKSCPRGPV